MLPIHPFRTSLYVSLALAILAVGVAGADLLPEFPYITAFGLALLGVAYGMEGRFELNLRDANLVGVFLSVALGLWGIFQFVRPSTGLSNILPWPASALPYLAPVLMVLIPAKLFRPKHTGDYWTMHGLGLVAVSLACAMASDGYFVAVFIAYAVSFVWGLATFQIYRGVGSELSRRVPVARARGRELRPAVVRAALVGALAVPLFWLTPRSGQNWQLGINDRASATGLGEGPVDMNGVGQVEVNREKVFEVYAQTRDGEPVRDLPGDLRWRAAHLQTYSQGSWKRDSAKRFNLAVRAFPDKNTTTDPFRRLPDFGPDTVYLTFVAGARLGSKQPLADPVAWQSSLVSPVVCQSGADGSFQSWNQQPDGAFDGFSVAKQYVQAWVRPADFNQSPVLQTLGPPVGLAGVPPELWRLKEFAEGLLQRLVDEKKLPAAVQADRDPVTGGPDPKYHDAVAQAISEHFAHSGEFTYTLDLKRQDKSIDPAEDFVLNVKAGHCQRFASALTLVLRSLAIPAQLVLGYRGLESRDDGWYDVREDHAHAWVEVLVPDAGPRLPPPLSHNSDIVFADAAIWQYRWRMLDPTPGDVETSATASASFFDRAKEQWEATLKSFLLAYNADSREKTARAVGTWFIDDRGWLLLALAAGGAIAGRRLWMRWQANRAVAVARAAAPSYFRALYDILARYGTVRPADQTPLEFAAAVADRLRANPATAAVAGVPVTLTEAYYVERFGLRPRPMTEVDELLAACRRLETALHSAR